MHAGRANLHVPWYTTGVMPEYPPPPPGDRPPPPPHDPYAADRALSEWAKSKGYELSSTADLGWYRGWYPFHYLFPINGVGRELRATKDGLKIWLVEGYEGDPVKQQTGEDHFVYAFATSEKLAYRAALRSNDNTGLVDGITQGITKGFGALTGQSAPTGTVLGDPTFEARYDVHTPSRDEGNAALPAPLRQLLLQQNFRGILEIRAKGMVCMLFHVRRLDSNGAALLVGAVEQIHAAAVQYPHAVTPG